MDQIKVLLVEDAEDQQKIFHSSVEVFNDKNKETLTLTFEIANSLDKARQVVDGSFDGVIVDLKLGNDENGGNKLIEYLNETPFRVPVIFVTGFPDLVNDHPLIIKKRARASDTYENDFKFINDIKRTGLTHIIGGRGEIERTLNKVFCTNLLPQLSAWIEYGRVDSPRTERALLRHTLNHLLLLLDNDEEKCFPEEVYISPPLVPNISTGSIVKKKGEKEFYAILNPACDLVIRRDGLFKTDRILLLEIETTKTITDSALHGITKNEKKESTLQKVLANNHTDYFHYLPKARLPKNLVFEGGFLNFRRLSTMSKEDFDKIFDPSEIQISPSFVKNIIARFSSYYTRQGQPDIDLENITSIYLGS